MHVFFLHSGGRENRWKELNGDNPIADYLVEIAFPHLEAVHGIKTDPQNIVINGQSLGGLSSLPMTQSCSLAHRWSTLRDGDPSP